MDQSSNTPDQPAGMTPPIEPGPLEERVSRWPTVIGVIGIVLASLSLICGCAGFFAVPLQRWGADMQAQSGQANPVAEAQLAAAEQYQLATMALVAVGMLLGAWLLYGSIALLSRQRKSRGILVSWAMASLFIMMLNIALQVLSFQAASAHLEDAGEAQRMSELWAGTAIGGCFGFVFGIAFQVFTLIWFSRRRIVAEIDTWK